MSFIRRCKNCHWCKLRPVSWIKDFFYLFRHRLNYYCRHNGYSYNPIVYVIEVGKKGYFHVHFLYMGKVNFKFVIEAWRDVTGLKANVNFSRPKICVRCNTLNANKTKFCYKCNLYLWNKTNFKRIEKGSDAMRYLAKYISKGVRNYYWLGKMLKSMPKLDGCSYPYLVDRCGYPVYRRHYDLPDYGEFNK